MAAEDYFSTNGSFACIFFAHRLIHSARLFAVPRTPGANDLLLITFHSQSGASARLAAAAREGALAQIGEVRCLPAALTGTDDVAQSSGILLVCAENSGRLAGGAKDFLDRCFYPLIERRCSLPSALLVSAGNDGRGAVEEARRILRGIPFVESLEPTIIRGVPDDEGLGRARELGEGFAAGLSMGIF